MTSRRRVVVTGIGAVSPVGLTAESTWQALISGVSGAGQITAFDPTGFKTTIAAEATDFDAEAYFERKDARRMDRCTQFALVAANEAMEHSGHVIAPEGALAARAAG